MEPGLGSFDFMTLSDRSDADVCPKCGGPLADRPEHPYPVLLQALFGLSFLLFLIFFDEIRPFRTALWGWSLAQAAMGIALVRGRMRARKRVYRCIRCTAALR